MNIKQKTVAALAAAATYCVALVSSASAEVYTWTGSASDVWNKTDANWDKGVWVDGNIAKFPDGASARDITLGADVTARGVIIASGDWSLGGNHTLTISGNATISQTSSASLTLRGDIAVLATANVENNINLLNIEGATFTVPSGKIFHNGWNGGSGLTGGATVNIGDGGTLDVGEFIISGSKSPADAGIYRVNVANGGVLRIGHFYKEYGITENRYGTLYFDGGTLEGGASDMFTYPASAVTIKAGSGGMRFGGGNNIKMYNSIASSDGADGGLTVDMTAALLYLNWIAHVGSEHTQRTFMGPVRLNSIGTLIIDSDRNLGAVPATPADGIIFNTSCRLLSQGHVRINPNRNILIQPSVTAAIATEGTSLAIESTISGAAPGTTRNGTLTTDAPANWKGDLSLLPPAGRTNSFGRLIVKTHDLTIGGEGTTEITDTLGNLDDLGDYGAFSVLGATLNVTNGLVRVMTNNYSIVKDGEVNVLGGTLDLSRQKMYVNAYSGAATTTIARVGTLITRRYCPSRNSSAEGSLTRLQSGGTLVCDEIYMHTGADGKLLYRGQIDFDGGVLSPQVASRAFFGGNSQDWFEKTPCLVREGGAVISNDVEIWTYHPFLSGAAHDGGLHKWGTDKLAVITTGNTFNGPVEVHQGQLVWGNDANYPATAKLVTHDGGIANINGKAQSLARVEGDGAVANCFGLTVTGAVAPGFGATVPGKLTFNQRCTFADGCVLEIDAGDTLCIRENQDISGLTLNVADISAFDKDAPRGTYKILDAPNGYTGTFSVGNLHASWCVRYTDTTAYLAYKKGMTLIIQ